MAGKDLSFPVCGNNGGDCYFSQTCCKLPNMAEALQVMMVSEGNKHKEVRFIKSRVWSCSGFTGHRGDGAAVDQLHLKSGLGCSLFTPGDAEKELTFSKTLCHLYCSKLSYCQLTLVFPKRLKNTSKAIIWSLRYVRSYSCFHFCICIFNVCSNNTIIFAVDGLKLDRRARTKSALLSGWVFQTHSWSTLEFVTFIFGKRAKTVDFFKTQW